MCVAGRTGLAHYNCVSRRWKLFGNEAQEKDFVVTGGMLWWRDYIVIGMASVLVMWWNILLYRLGIPPIAVVLSLSTTTTFPH